MPNELLAVRNLKKHYRVSRGVLREKSLIKALDGVTFHLNEGKTLAVVGESGCGKSTLAKLLTLIEKPTEGEISLGGIPVDLRDGAATRELRRQVQMVFQNPFGSLNPRKRIGDCLEEPLRINTELTARERQEKVAAILEQVGLRPEHQRRYPHMFSGGQLQRIAIARALILQPKAVIADEPVSALDVSIQAQVLNLLMDLQEKLGVAYLFISHNLAVVELIADEVAVVYLGKIVEFSPKRDLFSNPQHPYTRALLASMPRIGSRSDDGGLPPALQGELPSPFNPPPGCPFHQRCSYAISSCRVIVPELKPIKESHQVACLRMGEI